MVPLFVQTLLLLGAAYFIGAALACIIRRSLFAATRADATGERRVDPLPEAVEPATGPDRFGHSPRLAPAPPTPVANAPIAPARQSEPGPAQDLKRIRLIDAKLEAGLNKLGVHRYDEIAAWMQPDVRRIGDALGLGGRINQENWIEQAQVLAKGGETYYATRRARGEAASAAPTPDEGARMSASTPSSIAPRPSTGGGAGASFDSPPDVAERAAFAHRQAPAAASATARTQPNPLPPTVPSAQPAPAAAVPIRPATAAMHDNLLRISGIDAEVEKLLTSQGVTRYSQIAHWSPADVDRFDRLLGTGGRIGRENWIEQAQILSRGGDTKFSLSYDRGASPPAPRPVKLADAIHEHAGRTGSETAATRPANPDFGALRSVRSEAYQNADAGVAGQNKVPRSAGPDDLKRIRGIGVLIEKKLNSMGVAAYEQIANWTAADIDRVSQSLDFKGRIERENWIEQARILASGGATEFSRRVDRGEMDTGQPKR
jgi:predicted flap endonuclease-1-like 5' DNA nuclease